LMHRKRLPLLTMSTGQRSRSLTSRRRNPITTTATTALISTDNALVAANVIEESKQQLTTGSTLEKEDQNSNTTNNLKERGLNRKDGRKPATGGPNGQEGIVGLLSALNEQFRINGDRTNARDMSAYLRNQFAFYGIKKPLRASLTRKIFKENAIVAKNSEEGHKALTHVVTKLWTLEQREYQYAAIDLALHYKKFWQPSSLDLFEGMIRQKSWWDTVDTIASNLVGSLIVKHPNLEARMDQWIEDEHMWIRRSALLYQLKYKHKTNEDKLFGYCKKVMKEDDFFIRKAVGWVLRNYSKTNHDAVRDFLKTNRSSLSSLSFREGSKYVSGV
jgi:3-methyladenine DNA glycosylase AlkD